MSVALPEVSAVSVEELSAMFETELPCEHGKGSTAGVRHHPCAVPATFALSWRCPAGHRLRRMYCTEHKAFWLAAASEWGGVLCSATCDELAVLLHVAPLT